jgi:uncharacterized protein (DUF2236 family)
MVDELAGSMTEQSRQVARSVLHPRLPVVLTPIMAMARGLAVGLLPAPLRQGFDLPWSPRGQRALDALAWTTRAVLPRVPPRLRQVPTGRITRASGY